MAHIPELVSILIFLAGVIVASLRWLARKLGTMQDEITNVRYILVGAPESRDQSVLSRLQRIESRQMRT